MHYNYRSIQYTEVWSPSSVVLKFKSAPHFTVKKLVKIFFIVYFRIMDFQAVFWCCQKLIYLVRRK